MSRPEPRVLQQDLDAALGRTRDRWMELSGARLFLTGATGFVGTLLLESIAHARARAGADLRVVVLVREPLRLFARLPWAVQSPWLDIVRGDVRTFTLDVGAIDYAIHAANTGSPEEIAADPEGVARMVVDGSLRIRDLATAAGVRRMLQLSSGSVSGAHFTPAPPITEDDPGVPIGAGAAACLARAKRDAERALLVESRKSGAPEIVLARGFALCGPWIPLDSAFAFGNFIGAALRREPIRVSGDGTPVRSYLYAGDLIVWLWNLLLKGEPGRAYNVGSEHAVSISELAHRVSDLLGSTVEIAQVPVPGARSHWHVPNTARARSELGLEETVPLDEAIARTAKWWVEHGGIVAGQS